MRFLSKTASALSQIRSCCFNMNSPTIRVPELKNLLCSGSVRVLDASFSAAPCAGPVAFNEKSYYGKVDELSKIWKNEDYEKEHIPGAVHFHNDIATYPGEHEKAALYEKEVFQKYLRFLGLNQGDKIVVYGRGMVGGMLFAARAWWLLKVYGVENVKVLEGGLEKWKAEGGEVTDVKPQLRAGNITVKEPCKKLLATYEELFEQGSCDGVQRNLLDARPPGQFTGAEPLAFPPNGATGTRLQGAKNVPLPSLLENGELKSAEELKKVLLAAGVDPSKQSITYCNAGTQASMLALALDKAGLSCRVFNGSLVEVSRRNSGLISASCSK